MNKKPLLAAVLMLTVVSTIALAAAAVPALLTPRGRVRVALLSYGSTGYARWVGSEPEVFDGSFSAALYTGTDDSSGGKILIGPLSWPLSMLTDDRITFMAYFYSSETGGHARPFINIVLDNGRWIEGESSTSVSGAAIQNEEDQGYRSADLWVRMKPSVGWYTSYGTSATTPDPVLVTAGVGGCELMTPCSLTAWKTAFPTARVIQIQIENGSQAPTGQQKLVFIDNVSLLGMTVLVEPEVIAATP